LLFLEEEFAAGGVGEVVLDVGADGGVYGLQAGLLTWLLRTGLARDRCWRRGYRLGRRRVGSLRLSALGLTRGWFGT
jgi:hypothetical protein